MRGQKIITAFMVAIFAVLAPAARAAALEQAVIDEVRGPAFVVQMDNAKRPAQVGDFVFGGEVIETGPKASVRLVLEDGSVLRISEQTRLEISDERSRVTGGQMVVLYLGRIWCQVTRASDGGTALEVTTTTVVAGVRGTVFSAGVGLDGSTRVGVEEGEVEVAGGSGKAELDAGRETTIELEGRPAAPTAFDAGEEGWQQWGQSRRNRLIKNADRIVPALVGPVRQSRMEIRRLREQGQSRQQRLRQTAARRLAAGRPALNPAQRRELEQYLRELASAVRDLYLADRRMMSRYYLLRGIQEDAKVNPTAYTPELLAAVDQAVAELDRLDVQKIHAENQQIIDAYAAGLQEFQERHQMGRYRKGTMTPAERREAVRKARQEYRERQPR